MHIETPTLPGHSSTSVIQFNEMGDSSKVIASEATEISEKAVEGHDVTNTNSAVATASGSMAVCINAAEGYFTTGSTSVTENVAEENSVSDMPQSVGKSLTLDISSEPQQAYPCFECISPVSSPSSYEFPTCIEEATIENRPESTLTEPSEKSDWPKEKTDHAFKGLFQDLNAEPRSPIRDELWADLQEFLEDKKRPELEPCKTDTIIETCEPTSSQYCELDVNSTANTYAVANLSLSLDCSQESQQLSTSANPLQNNRNTDAPSETTETHQTPNLSLDRHDANIYVAPNSTASQEQVQRLSNSAHLTPKDGIRAPENSEPSLVTESSHMLTEQPAPLKQQGTIATVPSSHGNNPIESQPFKAEPSVYIFDAPIFREAILNQALQTFALDKTTNQNMKTSTLKRRYTKSKKPIETSGLLEKEKKAVDMVLARAVEAAKMQKSKAQQFFQDVQMFPQAVYTISQEPPTAGNSVQSSTTADYTGPRIVNLPQIVSTQSQSQNSHRIGLNTCLAPATTSSVGYNLNSTGDQPAIQNTINYNGGPSYSQNGCGKSNPTSLPQQANLRLPSNYCCQQFSNQHLSREHNQQPLNYMSSPSYPQKHYPMSRPSPQQPNAQMGMPYGHQIPTRPICQQTGLPQGFKQHAPRPFTPQANQLPIGAGSYGSQPVYRQGNCYGSQFMSSPCPTRLSYTQRPMMQQSLQQPMMQPTVPHYRANQTFVQQGPQNQQFYAHPVPQAPQQLYPMHTCNQQIGHQSNQQMANHQFCGSNYAQKNSMAGTQMQVHHRNNNGYQYQYPSQHNGTMPSMNYPIQSNQPSQHLYNFQPPNAQIQNYQQNTMYQQQPSAEATTMIGQACKRHAESEPAIQQASKLRAVPAASFDNQRFVGSPNVMNTASTSTAIPNAVYQPDPAVSQNATHRNTF